jgi:hypothetical protein
LRLLEELQAKAAQLNTRSIRVALYDGRFATVRAPTIEEMLLTKDIHGQLNKALKLLSLVTLIENKPIGLSELLKLHHADLDTLSAAASKVMKL